MIIDIYKSVSNSKRKDRGNDVSCKSCGCKVMGAEKTKKEIEKIKRHYFKAKDVFLFLLMICSTGRKEFINKFVVY